MDITHSSARSLVQSVVNVGAVLPPPVAAAAAVMQALSEPTTAAAEAAGADDFGTPYLVRAAQADVGRQLLEQVRAGRPPDLDEAQAMLQRARQEHDDARDLLPALLAAGAAHPFAPNAHSALATAVYEALEEIARALHQVLVQIVERALRVVDSVPDGTIPANDAEAYRAPPESRRAYDELAACATIYRQVRAAGYKLRELHLDDHEVDDRSVVPAAEFIDVGAHWIGAGGGVVATLADGSAIGGLTTFPSPWPEPGTPAFFTYLADHPEVRPWVPTPAQLRQALNVEAARRQQYNEKHWPRIQMETGVRSGGVVYRGSG